MLIKYYKKNYHYNYYNNKFNILKEDNIKMMIIMI